MVIDENMGVGDKLKILTDAAKYDVACTSSGVDRSGDGSSIGNTAACGICHAFSADGRCVSLLKILFTNECIFDCKYCINRSSNDVPRATFTPEEVCRLTIEFYRRNYIEGLFLSSGIIESPNYTMSMLYQTLFILRNKYHFNGYIHVKGIPGADLDIIERTGYLADRMSVNLELPTADGLRNLAPNKKRRNMLVPIKHIQKGITDFHYAIGSRKGKTGYFGRDSYPDGTAYIDGSGYRDTLSDYMQTKPHGGFVPAGQSTQMIIGATPESDYQIMTVAETMYKKYDMKRVFYSAFVDVNRNSTLPAAQSGPPLLREHRLYQADWLLRYYGFRTGELLSEDKPNFNVLLDPKCDWALRHLEMFPVEINKADYYTLLRVPGIGVNSAKRIIAARKQALLDFSHIKKMGVVLKRAVYFITCRGRMMYSVRLNEDYITRQLVYGASTDKLKIDQDITYNQLSMFDDSMEWSIG